MTTKNKPKSDIKKTKSGESLGLQKKSSDDSDRQEKSNSAELDDTAKKDDPNEWRIKKYLPPSFRERKSVDKKENTIRAFLPQIRLDCNVLNNFTTFSQIFIFVTSLIIIITIAMGDCFGEGIKQVIKEVPVYNNNNTNSTQVTTEKTTYTDRFCVPQLYFMFLCIITANVILFSIILYMFHIVEAFPNIPWLAIESIWYSVWAFQYFLLSMYMCFTNNGWFIMIGVLGFIDSLLFVILAKIKYSQCGQPAQGRAEDPDGNVFRRTSPNYKFRKSDTKKKYKDKHELSKIKKTDSLE